MINQVKSNLALFKELFDKEQIGIKEPFPVTNFYLLHKDKELLALRNNFRATKKFLIAKVDYNCKKPWLDCIKTFENLILYKYFYLIFS